MMNQWYMVPLRLDRVLRAFGDTTKKLLENNWNYSGQNKPANSVSLSKVSSLTKGSTARLQLNFIHMIVEKVEFC